MLHGTRRSEESLCESARYQDQADRPQPFLLERRRHKIQQKDRGTWKRCARYFSILPRGLQQCSDLILIRSVLRSDLDSSLDARRSAEMVGEEDAGDPVEATPARKKSGRSQEGTTKLKRILPIWTRRDGPFRRCADSRVVAQPQGGLILVGLTASTPMVPSTGPFVKDCGPRSTPSSSSRGSSSATPEDRRQLLQVTAAG